MVTLTQRVAPEPDALYEHFTAWASHQGVSLYPHQDESAIEIFSGNNLILATPTGSGKSLVAVAAHYAALQSDKVSFYTAPIKALVSEKFFQLCELFGPENVGMITGDASVNSDAPIICCTAEILANLALREGPDADVGMVIADEFHFYSEPDRGWAWQVPLLELPQAQFLLMSATLGDVTQLADRLTQVTGRPTSVIHDARRPVPLEFEYSLTPLQDRIEQLVLHDKAPVYIVHFTQADALDKARGLLSVPLISKEEARQIAQQVGNFRFGKGFGKILAGLVARGIGVHHAGMLPKYRRLVEQLAQAGLLKVICGTDTLGVGINVPIRTVLFTGLTKFDGHRVRRLRSREFHQIAGRAGRAGFDTRGYVVVQAPEHVIENERALAKAGDDPKKRRRVVRKRPPEGFVMWNRETFDRIIQAEPENLHSRMRVNHAMILNVVQRPGSAVENFSQLLARSHEPPGRVKQLSRQALTLARGMLHSGVLIKLPAPDEMGRWCQLSSSVGEDFALNQPLAPFAVAALELLDMESPTAALDVVSVIEAVLEDPMQVLLAQQFEARGRAVEEMKAEGLDFDERMARLEDITWPQPLLELLEPAIRVFAQTHPWVSVADLSAKSVVRDMWERAMTFTQYISHYKLQRSEGTVLRYLSDAYRALRHTVPESYRSEELADLIEWLAEVIRQTDSSLLDEWEALTNPQAPLEKPEELDASPRRVTSNERAFTAMVRTAMWRRLELCALDRPDDLGELEASSVALTEHELPVIMDADAWDDALADYYEEHDEIVLDADARGPHMVQISKADQVWRVTQIVPDPAGNHDWRIEAEVDLAASDEAGAAVVRAERFWCVT